MSGGFGSYVLRDGEVEHWRRWISMLDIRWDIDVCRMRMTPCLYRCSFWKVMHEGDGRPLAFPVFGRLRSSVGMEELY